MRIRFEDFELSGKGLNVSGEYVDNNIKLIFDNTEFQEIVAGEDGSRVAWYVNGEFQLLADFTMHTNKGMAGESFDYMTKMAFVRDGDKIVNLLSDGQLKDVDIELTRAAFKKMFTGSFNNYSGEFKIDPSENSIVIISTVSEVVHVQNPEESVNISHKGVYVLKLDEEKLTVISERNGITVVNDDGKTVRIGGSKGIEIDGLDINFGDIAREIKNSVREAFMDLDF